MKQTKKEENNLKVLKFIVISMGIVLVLGTFGLFIAVAKRATSHKKPTATVAMEQKSDGCTYKDANIPDVDKIISATTSGNIVTIIATAKNNRQQIIIYDLCEGAIKGRISTD
jgi:hypothetical protein